jgi:hypothetical protein
VYPIAIIQTKAHEDLGRSALPDAPVVPETARPRPLRATRAAMAGVLHAAARTVEPAPRRRPEVHA